MKLFFRLLIVAFSLCFATHAMAATPEDAKNYARSIGDKVLGVLDDAHVSDSDKLTQLQALFVDVVDVNWVGRFVLGQYWRQATPEQQQEYIAAYGTFLVKNYTSNFAEYGGERFDVTTSREEREGEFFVRTEILRKAGQPVLVDYRVRSDDKGGFKVFDIIVEGVSLISTQRSEFASVVSRQGLDTLINLLKRKTIKLDEQMQDAISKKAGASSPAPAA